MYEVQKEAEKKIRALLVGEPGDDISELEGLVETLGLEIARSVVLTRLEVTPAYGMGKGKAEELSALAKELSADVIIFDFVIEPRKQRNWEKLAKIPVYDRQEVILKIFAERAQTKEAVLQVQLASLQYSLPRLAHSYGDMARQRGGNFGSKGSGETQLELDSRQIRDKIAQVKKELAQVVRDRETQRKKRERISLPSCALAGYTNAGKSSLLNALTGADVFVEDKLFATLDPTTRKLSLKNANGANILLTDTVGFISNLPHTLVNAFKSTLEEAQRADLILLVLDASDLKAEFQYDTVCKVLKEIGAEETPKIVVLNKVDKIRAAVEHSRNQPENDTENQNPRHSEFISESADKNENPDLFLPAHLARLESLFPDAVEVSAKTHEGFDELFERISSELLGSEKSYVIPVEKSSLLNEVRKTGLILEENWLDDGVHVKAKGGELRKNPRLSNLLSGYEI